MSTVSWPPLYLDITLDWSAGQLVIAATAAFGHHPRLVSWSAGQLVTAATAASGHQPRLVSWSAGHCRHRCIWTSPSTKRTVPYLLAWPWQLWFPLSKNDKVLLGARGQRSVGMCLLPIKALSPYLVLVCDAAPVRRRWPTVTFPAPEHPWPVPH